MASAEVVAKIKLAREAVIDCSDVDRSSWSSVDRSTVLLALIDLHERIQAAVLGATADWDGNQAWAADGALTPAAWLRSTAAMPEAEARRTVRAARLVQRNETLAKALRAGDITAGHVEAISRHVTPPRADLFDEHADVLLDAARTLNADDTARVMRRWAAYADDHLHRGQPEDLLGRRGAWFRQVGDMTEGRVVGTAEEMAALKAAMDRLEPPDAKGTPGGARSTAQRRYDALMHMAALGLQDRNGNIDPENTVHIVIDAATLAGEFNPEGRSDILGGSSVLPVTVQRLLCGSWISRVILDAKGEPLDLGRRARLFSAAQKRAIRQRDGGCVLACCDRPPEWTDAHHLDPWGPPTEGETNLANGVSLCRPHHTLVHEHSWVLYQDADGQWYVRPP